MTLRKLFSLATGLLMTASMATTTIYAAETSAVQSVIDETYVQPEYVMGYSLSEAQKAETLSLLGYDTNKDTKVKTLTTDSFAAIMNVANDPSLQLYSSVRIQKLGASETLTVKIVTPENITKVTEDMYRNAAVTLGIEHAAITVAAPLAVTGESALAGIYYSLEENGASIPTENKELAQEELSALATINQENEGKDGYDADKLNVALTDIKTAVANAGEGVTEEQVRQIVEDTLTNYQLKDVLSDSHINLIINFSMNLSKSDIINNVNFTNTLSSLKDSIVSEAGSVFNNINLNFDANSTLESGKGFFANIWQQIVDFFSQFFN